MPQGQGAVGVSRLDKRLQKGLEVRSTVCSEAGILLALLWTSAAPDRVTASADIRNAFLQGEEFEEGRRNLRQDAISRGSDGGFFVDQAAYAESLEPITEEQVRKCWQGPRAPCSSRATARRLIPRPGRTAHSSTSWNGVRSATRRSALGRQQRVRPRAGAGAELRGRAFARAIGLGEAGRDTAPRGEGACGPGARFGAGRRRRGRRGAHKNKCSSAGALKTRAASRLANFAEVLARRTSRSEGWAIGQGPTSHEIAERDTRGEKIAEIAERRQEPRKKRPRQRKRQGRKEENQSAAKTVEEDEERG